MTALELISSTEMRPMSAKTGTSSSIRVLVPVRLAGRFEDPAWALYLRGLSTPDADLARELWQALVRAIPEVRTPQAGPRSDGGFQFVWDKGDHHLEVDVLHDRSFEWFYRNRRTNAFEAEDELSLATIPPKLRAYFDLLTRA